MGSSDGQVQSIGKGEAAGRRAWMEKDGGLVEADV
jgi:topoisomerase-4 subunit B